MSDVSEPDREPPPLRFGDPATGWYWSAERDHEDDDEPVDYAVAGTSLTFSWDFGVTVPLWDDEGLLPDNPEWLRTALGLSVELIRDLDRWGRDMLQVDEGKPPHSQSESMDTRAQTLVERLRQELAGRFFVTYRP